MKKNKYIFLLLFTLSLTSCSEYISVFVKIFGLDNNSEKLEIEFDFNRFVENEKVAVRSIKIYRNDSLNYELESESEAISDWRFPELPNGFKIKYPIDANAIEPFSKNDKIRFEFKGNGKYAAYGSWKYEPKYSTKKYRWLFDKEGNQKVNIDCSYEPWIGKDLIKVVSNESFKLDINSFQLLDIENKAIEYELKSKKELPNRVALALKKNFKKGKILYLSFKGNNGEKYETQIIVPKKSSLGLAGKYSDL